MIKNHSSLSLRRIGSGTSIVFRDPLPGNLLGKSIIGHFPGVFLPRFRPCRNARLGIVFVLFGFLRKVLSFWCLRFLFFFEAFIRLGFWSMLINTALIGDGRGLGEIIYFVIRV